jgi:CDP-diacylglycerol--glycerol-3-phosphate 3-phosphatidyltransferase
MSNNKISILIIMIIKKNIPNLITLIRLTIAPAILIYMLAMHDAGLVKTEILAFSMILIFCTDFLDGYFARKYQEVSFLGSLFDGLADKVIIYAIFLFYLNHGLSYLPIYLLLVRDLLILTLKHFSTYKNIKLDVVWPAKLKFTSECLLSITLLYKFKNFSNILLIIVVIIAWYSAIKYYLNFLKKYSP